MDTTVVVLGALANLFAIGAGLFGIWWKFITRIETGEKQLHDAINELHGRVTTVNHDLRKECTTLRIHLTENYMHKDQARIMEKSLADAVDGVMDRLEKLTDAVHEFSVAVKLLSQRVDGIEDKNRRARDA